ncbi:MAG: hypothetical protein KDD89_00585 [Anaerolineales bacterium]|nr:hypothetical protein [Anaerolineales bacterium]
MPHLAISLFGALRVAIDQHAVQNFSTTKVQALLAYLAVEQHRAHERSALAALFWPDQRPELARNNLRQTLFRLRQALGDQQHSEPFVALTRTTVQFNADCSHWLDVAQFTTAVKRLPHTTPQDTPQLTQAVTLFQGDFLEQVTLGDSIEFEEWAIVQRQWYRQKMLEACHQLANHHLLAGQPAVAQEFAWRQVALEPLREEGHRQVMEALAWRGQRSAAVAQYERCAALLESELGVGPAPETQALYQQIVSGAWPPLTSAAAHQHQPEAGESLHTAVYGHDIPPHNTPFIGYDQEQKQIQTLLQRPDCRLLTITGLAGVGKTALAREVAHQHGQPSLWLDLSAANADLHDAALQAQLRSAHLLVLDGLDWLDKAGHTAVLLDILAEHPQLTILATARRRLNLPGEWVFDLVGLAYPDRYNPDTDPNLPSVQLFWQTARRVNSDLTPTAEDWQAIAQICRLVEGHPLGIELAAQWTRLLRCPAIAQELTNTLHFLTKAESNTARALTTLFKDLWQALSPLEQDALRNLAWFPGGFGRQAAKQVANVSQATLLRLLDGSLLRRTTADFYQMPAILRHFVRQQKPDPVWRARFVNFYLQEVLAGQAAALGGAGNQQEAVLVGLRREWRNLAQAWRWLAELNLPAPAQWPTAVETFTLLCEKLGEHESGVALLTAVRPQRPAHEQPIWQLAEGWLLFLSGQIAPAQRLVQGVVDELAPQATPRLAWRAQIIFARLLLADGSCSAAASACRQALALCQQERDHDGAALILLVAARVALQEGDHGRAWQLGEQSQTLWQHLHNRWRQAETLFLLGEVARAQGQLAQAHQLLVQALKLWQGLQAQAQLLVCWQWLGELARQQGQVGQARQWYEAMFTAALATNQPDAAVVACRAMGQLARQAKQYSAAQTLYQQGVQVAMRHQLRPQLTVLLVELGELWAEAHWLGENRADVALALSPEVARLVQNFFGQLTVQADGVNLNLQVLATAVVNAFLGPENSATIPHLDDLLTDLQL